MMLARVLKGLTGGLLLAACTVGCSDSTSSIPDAYANSEQPASPPALTGTTSPGGESDDNGTAPPAPEPPKLDL